MLHSCEFRPLDVNERDVMKTNQHIRKQFWCLLGTAGYFAVESLSADQRFVQPLSEKRQHISAMLILQAAQNGLGLTVSISHADGTATKTRLR